MKGLRISRKRGIYLSDSSIPKPASDEVLIRVKAAGVCGSDLKIVTGEFEYKDDIILGHECSGTIEAVGNNAGDWEIGERVIIDPTLTCQKCQYCLSGKQNLCVNMGSSEIGELGVDLDGAFAEYVKIRKTNVYRIPDNLSFSEATMVEPLACILNGFNRLQLTSGSACIIGLGPAGMLWSELFRLKKIRCFGMEISDFRSKFGVKLGIKQATEADETYDYVVDTTGSNLSLSCKLVKRGGKIVVFGMAPSINEKVNTYTIAKKDLEIIGVNMDARTFGQAIQTLPKLRTKEMITDNYPLDKYENAFKKLGFDCEKLSFTGEASSLKMIICP